MKTILVDAIHTFLDINGVADEKMFELLQEFNAPKILCTNAGVEKFSELNLDRMTYPVFTLSGQPRKDKAEYFTMLMEEYGLFPEDCIYFEHDLNAVTAAKKIGITTYHFDSKKRDLDSLKTFLKSNLE